MSVLEFSRCPVNLQSLVPSHLFPPNKIQPPFLLHLNPDILSKTGHSPSTMEIYKWCVWWQTTNSEYGWLFYLPRKSMEQSFSGHCMNSASGGWLSPHKATFFKNDYFQQPVNKKIDLEKELPIKDD